jgi:dipeptide/tripeptide permease
MQTQKMYLSILWQLPQYFMIGIAEILTYLSHLNFAYKEAPPSMKPVMMSLLYLSMAGGDLVVAIFSSLSLFPTQSFEYAFYSALVLVAVIVLMFLANRYENTRLEIIDDDEEAALKALTAKEEEEPKENVTQNGK